MRQSGSAPLPSLAEAKAMARELRQARADAGESLRHSAALEQVARDLGFRDWNGCAAALQTPAPRAYRAGDRVAGRYLSQPFTARVLRVGAAQAGAGWVRLDLDLDQPVDVVRFETFSNLRRRISGVIGPEGFSREKTSDGVPHLVIETLLD
ncbi:glyoxalase superfamily protein [Phaeobacter sp. HF9A]|uniref:glyoxalase superfamily protein n=1 Tax=Phaeobacter sp. HF9A TaxID=2721561 RepID=UPI0034C6A4EF